MVRTDPVDTHEESDHFDVFGAFICNSLQIASFYDLHNLSRNTSVWGLVEQQKSCLFRRPTPNTWYTESLFITRYTSWVIANGWYSCTDQGQFRYCYLLNCI